MNASLVMEIVAPLVMSRPTPRSAVSVASVMMKGGKPRRLTPKAWKVPMATPNTSVMRIAAQIGKSFVSSKAMMTLAKPTTAPTDRSIPAVMMTKVSPIARIAVIDALTQQVGDVVGCPEACRAERQRHPHEREQAQQGQAQQRADARPVFRSGG